MPVISPVVKKPGREARRWLRPVVLLMLLAATGWLIGHAVGALWDWRGKPFQVSHPALGTLVEISVRPQAGLTEAELWLAAEQAFFEIDRVDRLFSTHKIAGEEITEPEQGSIGPAYGPADATELAELLEVAELGFEIGRLSRGALDLRLRTLIELWNFDNEPRIPDPRRLDSLMYLRRFRSDWDGDLAELHFGAIAKGYAVDRALETLAAAGVKEALVNAGGEIRALGDGWTVGVQHPRLSGMLLTKLEPGELAVATSGDYERYFETGGRRYHHLLDPASGWPAADCRSVTVVAPSCALADAWATALFVLGPEAGLRLAEELKTIEALIVGADGREQQTGGFKRLRRNTI